MNKPIKILLADDSPTMLKMFSGLLAPASDIRIAGTAQDGAEALTLARSLKPDLITLDVRMPRMDGIEASQRIMTEVPSRILVISGAVDAEMSFRALQAGALEVMPKPTPLNGGISSFGTQLISTIRSMAGVPLTPRRPIIAPPGPPPVLRGGRVNGFGLVAATGGPPALAMLLSLLPPTLPYPVFIAQHVSVGFTSGLRQWLSAASPLPIEVARTGMRPQAGYVYLPPDGHQMQVLMSGEMLVEPISPLHGTLGDALLHSLARAYGNRAGGAVLTGMGSDGATGLLAIRRAGGLAFAQSPDSCVVPGMPEAALRNGAAESSLAVDGMASALRALSGPLPTVPLHRS
ncbi:chemotaxis protein CheB [Hyalangium rubrum]|uniref:protein-glutamate methylesterase n=1 Tax=Hyalangium rubrum TaxID=3103134 RepID=A0ABU5HAY5_9BACT|nr:chemotaxis protein CheB [Hyalangium sp. s54d21]MDY7230628.1 chemotaxis protein CheB [Hyalangium sp. s54d21]